MKDIYDGQMWKDCSNINGRPFLSQPNNLALTMNVDWFRPFKHSQYSIGVVYVAVLNLPREIRYLPANIIITGIIPGPNEPSKTEMNPILEPIVKDLLTLWDGVHITIPTLHLPVRIRAMLLCITCDIPACRKVCGFIGHNGHLACSKCKCFFPGTVIEGFDYSGYVTAAWQPRDHARHCVNATATKVAPTQTAREELVSQYGLRYSVLLKLPYLNIVRQHVIDPMHSLFLGVAKHAVSVWKDTGILSPGAMVRIQETVNAVEVPSSLGRIPGKIASGFAGFTADQWKHWILIYSIVALKGILPDANFSCWTKFVHACILACSERLTLDTISQAHHLIVEYCQAFQELYGSQACTINMHLACHMADCLRDFGPAPSFWCFSFERMNGQLGAIPTNSHSVEVQLMRKFVDSMCLNSFVHSESQEVQSFLQTLTHSCKRGTLSFVDANSEDIPSAIPTHASSHSVDNLKQIVRDSIGQETISGSRYTTALTTDQHARIARLCQVLFGDDFQRLEFVCDVYSQVAVAGQDYGSTSSRLLRSAHVKAYYTTDVSGLMSNSIGIGSVNQYIRVAVNLSTVRKQLSLALIEWLGEHPDRHSIYPTPVELWRHSTGASSFIPVASFVSRVAMLNCDSGLVVIPLQI